MLLDHREQSVLEGLASFVDKWGALGVWILLVAVGLGAKKLEPALKYAFCVSGLLIALTYAGFDLAKKNFPSYFSTPNVNGEVENILDEEAVEIRAPSSKSGM